MSLLATPPMPESPADEPLHGHPNANWPIYRTFIALDMEGSTLRTNPAKRVLRDRMYLLLEEGLRRSGVGAHHLDRLTDRGDGVLALIRPADAVPKTLLLDSFIPTLVDLLTDYNHGVADQPPLCLRLRVVIHAGDIHDDGKGFFGEELDVAFRLLDSPHVKRALALSAGSLALAISDEIFRAIVRHGYGTINAGAYRHGFCVRVSDRQRQGWILNDPGSPSVLAR
ncbi:hypothetical protein [Actinomadura sp. 6N118]|uniref:hypothetical protein n=1 Tax=Actinomadura sp. 6N118 TaxID=3375151 RepID=UPI00378A5572